MDSEQEIQIIKLVQRSAEETGGCNIAEAAHEILFYKPSRTEQEAIANKIIRSRTFLKMEVDNNWVIYLNPNYKEPLLEVGTERKLSFIHFLIIGVLGLAIYFGRTFFQGPIPPAPNQKILRPDFTDTAIPLWQKPIKFDTSLRKKN